jgi:(1->4)-alpha-D-glucan 1-alpha-D-glucosylmutase
LQSESTANLRAEIADAAHAIAPAGALNSLTQCLLRVTVPGLPDLYQGTEFWDFSLVDPDNRAPVDYDQRQVAFAVEPNAADLIDNWRDGRIKQWLIAQTLQLRAAHPQLFAHGRYLPLTVGGAYADRIIAFAREQDNQWLLVLAPRLTVPLLGDSAKPHISADHWEDTYVQLPAELAQRQLHGLFFSSAQFNDNRLLLKDALKNFPLNLYVC